MRAEVLRRLLDSEEEVERSLQSFLAQGVLRRQGIDLIEVRSHVKKARHNLEFVADSLRYPDWALVGCYYAAYHMALALIQKRGLSSKNHDATLTALIHCYYRQVDISFINDLYLNMDDIMFYAELRQGREKASYGPAITFDRSLVRDMQLKARLFVAKGEAILG
jgi:uncharacterized protein (UPF0332 family)